VRLVVPATATRCPTLAKCYDFGNMFAKNKMAAHLQLLKDSFFNIYFLLKFY
jgi:hypothetical protein